MPRELTPTESAKKFVNCVSGMVTHYTKSPLDREQALESLAGSIMAALDGSRIDVPGYAVIPNSDPEYVKDHVDNGLDYDCIDRDIAGNLSSFFTQARQEMKAIIAEALANGLPEPAPPVSPVVQFITKPTTP